jgi:hypothetical protein
VHVFCKENKQDELNARGARGRASPLTFVIAHKEPQMGITGAVFSHPGIPDARCRRGGTPEDVIIVKLEANVIRLGRSCLTPQSEHRSVAILFPRREQVSRCLIQR